MTTTTGPTTTSTTLSTNGPYDLGLVASMGFGHRDEHFDGVMRLAFCLDGDYERHIGVEVRQHGATLDLTVHPDADGVPITGDALDAVARQVARVISVDQDGAAFAAMCAADPVLARVQAADRGFRPALFYSPYEAAIWSVISARRARPQGIRLRQRMSEAHGATFELAGRPTVALPSPTAILALEEVPGLPADRIPRLHAVAAAAQAGKLSAQRFQQLGADAAQAELLELPGIGPFYSALITVRATGFTDVLSTDEKMSRASAAAAYGYDHELTDAEFAALAERWRPFRTWALVLLRAHGGAPPA